MADPGRGAERGPDPGAEHAAPRGGETARRQPSAGERTGRYDNPEAQLGGADAVEKTTYVVGEGTEPDARSRGVSARGAAAGTSLGVWIIGGIAALIALVYAIGMFR